MDAEKNEIFRSLPIGLLRLDNRLRITWASDQFLELFQCEPSDVEGLPLDKIISRNDRKGQASFYSQLTQNKNGKIDTHVSVRIGQKDFLVHLRMYSSEDGSMIVVYLEDLLGSQNLIFRLLWDEEMFSNIVLSSGEGIVILDKDNKIIEFNRKFFEFMEFKSPHGVTISEPALVGKDLFVFLGNAFVNFRKDIHHSQTKHQSHVEVLWYNNRCFEVVSSPTIIPIKGFAGNCIVFKDITAQKISEELTKRMNLQSFELELKNQELNAALQKLSDSNDRLNQTNSEMNYLVGVVAHDLRSPLNHIIGLTQLISKEQSGLSSFQTDCIRKVSEASLKLRSLVDKILDIEAMERRVLKVDLKPINVADELMRVSENYQATASNKGIVIHRNFASQNVLCISDSHYISLIFENLLSNAIKFSNHNSTITLNLFWDNGKVKVEVIDKGPGFTNEELPRLFMRFQSFRSKPTANEESHGLGLSIVKKYCDAINCIIHCDSTPGEGARFTVIIPALDASQHPDFK
jgi:signal transduction histidine kinase